MDLFDGEGDGDASLRKLRSNVRRGVWFHFAKFYIVLMPFYCGVQEATIPLSIVLGSVFGFILMWAVFGESIWFMVKVQCIICWHLSQR